MLTLLKPGKFNKYNTIRKYANTVNDNSINRMMKPLRKVISCNANKKVVTILPISDNAENREVFKNYTGVMVVYENDPAITVECGIDSIGVIMWYFNMNNDKFSNFVDHDTKYYIIKNLE
jgi:hypothetical protein